MRRILPIVFALALLLTSFSSEAQIAIGTVGGGPYTPGSGIAGTFTLGTTNCIRPESQLELYLSDANGNFANEIRIGIFSHFYSTFVNGIIPSNTVAGTGYRVRVKSTAPVLISDPSNPFEIKAGAPVNAEIGHFPALEPEVFGSCSGVDNTDFDLTNSSTPGSTVTGTVTNELTHTSAGNLTFSTATQTFTARLAHYTVLITAKMPDGSTATKAYMIVNNNISTSFSTTGNNVVCLPGGSLIYGVDMTSSGMGNNFPGNTYKIVWGDNTETIYTYCDLLNIPIAHEYLRSSCGNPPYNTGGETLNNVFAINISAQSYYCGPIGTSLSTSARVVTKPKNDFVSPAAACTNTDVTFMNTSTPGQNPNANTPACQDNEVRYNWFVNGVKIAANLTRPTNFVYKFPTHGVYNVRLESVSGSICQGAPVSYDICIQDPPQPSFDFNGATTTGCAPFAIAARDKSVVDNICNNNNTYNWVVTPAAGVTFTNGIKNPTFTFNNPGIYNVALEISTASCGVVRTPAQTLVIVDSSPVVTLSPNITLCTLGTYSFDNVTIGPTKTQFSGTQVDLPDTYTWTVTAADGSALPAGDFSFENGTTPNTKYPSIKFTQNKAYKISVTHKNSCSSITGSQLITFSPSPVPQIIVNPAPVCFKDLVPVQANITGGAYHDLQWTGLGTFSDPVNINTVYTPTLAERAAGTARITLWVNTGLSGACAQVSTSVNVVLLPNNTGVSTTQSICSGNMTNYTSVSSVPGSTFTWTAVNTIGTATGFSAAGTGDIKETLINTSTTANAVVVYTITPMSNGCAGEPFTFTVTVTPTPILTAVAAKPTICSNQPAGITLTTANLTGTKYTWTSVASAGVIGNTQQATAILATGINDVLINTGTVQGTVTYTITPVSATGCPAVPVSVTIKVDPSVTPANAGADESICDLATFTLKGNAAVKPNETGLWTVTSGQTGFVFADATSPATQVSGLISGQTYTFKWTISAPGACDPSSDLVDIVVNVPTVAGTISTTDPIAVCEGTNSGQFTLTGNVGAIIRWESSVDNGTTWLPVANTTATLAYTNLTVSTQYRVVVQNGSCGAKTTNIIAITVTPATTIAAAGADQTLCNVLSTQLDANTVLKPGETGVWTKVSGGANALISDSSNPKTTVTALAPGVYVFRWTITGPSACGPTSDEVTITNLPPLSNTISSTSSVVCSGQTILLAGSTPTGGDNSYTYVWESSTNGGTNWTVVTGETAKDLSAAITVTTRFRRTVNSGGCSLISNEYEVIAQPPITNNTIAASQTICTGIVPAPLTGSTPAGSDGNFNFQWQSSPDGTVWTDIAAAVGSGYTPTALTATTLYRRIVSTITCNGDQRSISPAVTITVKPNAKAEYTFVTDKGCIPFIITAQNVKAVPYTDRNGTYTWYADQTVIGTGEAFPGYTMVNSNTSVTIKLVVTSSLGCTQDEFSHVFSTVPSVAPSFTQSAAQGCGPLVVNFVNTSTSLTNATFKWDFGNGTTSSQTMPGAVTFLAEPTGKDTTYTVTLTATTPCGSNSITSTVFVKAKPISVFSPDKTTGCSPMKVNFSNTSPGGTNTYYYDFGDGTLLTKTDKLPVQHTYTTGVVKDYVVKMVAENDCGRNETSYTIRVSPNTILPELVVNAQEKQGCAPFKVNFYNNTKGASSFKYDFGDGGTVQTRTAPEVVTHTFTTPGTFNVVLTASNGCSDTTTTETITVLPQPLTAFTADNTLGCPGLVVQFRNTTTDGLSYLWDFGDGTTSNLAEPSHVYTAAQEFYTVTLTATNSLGCSYSLIKDQYIHIVPPPVAKFNVAPSTSISIPDYTFRFEDESTNNPASWLWDFGDKQTSAQQSPSHTYPDTGTYVVTLRVTNQQGCFTTTFKKVTITGVPGYLYLPNSFLPGSQTPELRVFKAKGSGIKSWRMSIFNKWGQELWQTTKLDEGRPAEGWDGTFGGTAVPQGVYFWKIDVEFINGTAWKGMTYDSSAPKKTGPIHLLR